MFNCFVRPGAYAVSAVGLLYGLNTAGAALGVLAAPFVFLNRVSLPATLQIVGTGNLLLGLAIWLHGRRAAPAVEEETSPEGARRSGGPALLALAFASGFVSLAFEVSLFRAFSTLNPSSAYNSPAVLMPFLLAIALGSVLWTRFGEYGPDRALRRIGWLFVGTVLATLLGIVLAAGLLLLGVQTAIRQQSRLLLLLLYGGILAVPLPFLLGGLLPLLMRLASGTGRSLPRESGRLYLSNSVGAFAGAMLAQFVGLPLLGTRGVVTGLVLIGLGAGGWCLARGRSRPRPSLVAATLVPTVAVVAFLVPAGVWNAYSFGATGETVDRVEGVSGVAVIRWLPSGGRVYVNGQYMSSLPDDARHVQLVSFALSLARRERVLGLGAGGLVRELVRDSGVRRVDVVDWSHELPRLLESPRARVLLADALRDPKSGSAAAMRASP